jgi:hypothetical protein
MMFTSRGDADEPGTIGGVGEGGPSAQAARPSDSDASTMTSTDTVRKGNTARSL